MESKLGQALRHLPSGDENASDRRGPISKQGSRYLRWALLDAALHRCNHPISRGRHRDETERRAGRRD